jgi:uncharacterized membrane protein YfcA
MSKKKDEKPFYFKFWFILIVTIFFASIGLYSSKYIPEDWKSIFQTGGIVLSFFGFLLMLFSGATKTTDNDEKTKFFVSLHPVSPMFITGTLCVFFGFFFQALGIEKSPF